jgi:hypothetical protein
MEGVRCPSCGRGYLARNFAPSGEIPVSEAPVRPGQDAIPQVDDLTEPPTRVSFELPPDPHPELGSEEQCAYCGGHIGIDGHCESCGSLTDNRPQIRRQGSEVQEMLARAAAHEGGEGEGMPKFAGDDPESRSWLMEDAGGGVDVDPALMAKLAGKDYSPREQREFIDEDGEARNLDKLELGGTHYVFDNDDPELALW